MMSEVHLPIEVWQHIAARAASCKDVCALGQTCRYLRPLLSDITIHACVLGRRYGVRRALVQIATRCRPVDVPPAMAYIKKVCVNSIGNDAWTTMLNTTGLRVNDPMHQDAFKRLNKTIRYNVLGMALYMCPTVEQCEAVVATLVDIGADPSANALDDATGKISLKPLHIAAYQVPATLIADMIRILLAHGAGNALNELVRAEVCVCVKRRLTLRRRDVTTRDARVQRRAGIKALNDAAQILAQQRRTLMIAVRS